MLDMTSTVLSRSGRAPARVLLLMAIAAAAAMGQVAWAQAPGAGAPGSGPVHLAHASGEHGGPGRFGGAGGWMMGRGLDRVLDQVNATDAQKAQIRQIAEAARADLRAQMEQQRGLRERGMIAFSQPTVDARELEAVRTQVLAQSDAASRRMTQALVDVSRVLTPEQRVQLVERMKQRSESMRNRMRSSQGHSPSSMS
jgi:periplasmic protein CpxP/Spy